MAISEFRISSGADDAEERVSGKVKLSSGDLELVDDGASRPDQTVGLRFKNLNIPQGAIINSAYIQFQVDETDSGIASLQIQGHDTDDAQAFSSTNFDVSSRPPTAATVAWTPPAWTTVGEADVDQQTSDISSIIQEIVNRAGWTPNNSLALIITGSGERTAESYDGNPSAAPLLHIEFLPPGPPSDPVVFNIPADTNIAPDQITEKALAGTEVGITASADDPDPGDTVTYSINDTRFDIDANSGVITRSGTGTLDFDTEPTITLSVTATSSDFSTATQDFTLGVLEEFRFAVFGDYGRDNSFEQAVANLVNGLDPDLILTTGDNVYGSRLIDDAIGQYYADYIGNYTGSYGSGSATNRFFPSLGNHEYSDDGAGLNGGIDIYLDYFTLPGVGTSTSGNERYYDFVQGPVHFFAVNSNSEEPDGRSNTSTQAQWLQTQLAASTSPWNIVYMHNSPYSSGVNHGSSSALQWDFEDWGATAVFSAHDHVYERILRDDNGDNNDLPYFVTGLGGHPSLYSFASPPVAGSAAQFNTAHGALLVEATATTITFDFYSVENNGTLIDSYTIEQAGAIFNSPPDADLGADQISQNSATGTTVGITASADDPDPGDTITYSVDDPRFDIDASSGVITRSATGTLDYQTEPTVPLVVTATSSDTSTAIQVFNLSVTEPPPPSPITEVRVSAGADDVEERNSGSVKLTGSDLELVDDNPSRPGQTIGLRFNGLNIPQNAIITSAYLQFQADETDTGTTTLQIHGHDTDNAPAFTSTAFDVSSRPSTSATVAWTPPDWTTVGEAGADQQTADITTIIQEIVNRSGWAANNSLALIITGSGERTAESFEGNPNAAPLLHIEIVAPTSGDDTLIGSPGDDTIDGLAGNDIISGLGGGDTLLGGEGNDTLRGDSGDDTLSGNKGDDILRGGDGNDTMNGDAGIDDLAGGGGNDIMNGGGESDTLVGQLGNDTLRGDGGDDTLSGNAGDDILRGGAGNDTMNGDAGIDDLAGGDGDDIMNGGSENDTLVGQLGNDTLRGNNGDDTLSGNNGDDILRGGDGNDTVNGDSGIDDLAGGSGNDIMSGGAGDDTLMGQLGDDTLNGGAGNDTLSGNNGVDSFVFNSGWGDDTIQDFGNGSEQMSMVGTGLTSGDLMTTVVGNDTVVTFSGVSDSITLIGITSGIDAGDFQFIG